MVTKVSDHVVVGPSGLLAQSNARTRLAISPSPIIREDAVWTMGRRLGGLSSGRVFDVEGMSGMECRASARQSGNPITPAPTRLRRQL